VSIIHYLSLGHFDASSIGRCAPVVLRPLEASALDQCLAAHYGVTSSDAEALATFKISCRDGFVEGLWFSPGPNQRFVRFALDLQERTGCDAADVRHARLLDRREVVQSLGVGRR
jgi:hypothetical protein